ncbi:YhgE/Pip domain-containing protein [Anaerotardibacter muris]|uniref:YhgE/Pip domain-containing protein n=1 Tax=Anaerotardibacter muris TaxID=2941505 RepID=UPI00203F50AE|nr:YhgE/Pip domain-containing protein [Anaerotardibacter muris]
MKNVLAIFKADLKSLMTNMIAAVVAMGLIIVPPMYAWLTTLGFWDPYANTGHIAVVVANEDEGYESQLLSTKLDAGAQIVSALHENDQFDWQFMDEDAAIESVRSGKSYAAFVIPKDFSKDLMTAFSTDAERPTIEYYTNQKINAIATHVTSEGASQLETQIDNTFTDTVAKVALEVTKDLSDYLSGEGISEYAELLSAQLEGIIEQVDVSIAQAQSFSGLMDVAQDLIAASQKILSDTGTITSDANALLDDSQNGLDEATGALDGMTSQINAALAQASASYNSVQAAVDAAFASYEGMPAEAEAVLGDLSNDVSSGIDAYRSLRSALVSAAVSQNAIDELDAAIAALERLSESLRNAQESVGSTAASIAQAKQSVQESLDNAKASIGQVSSTLEDELEGQATALASDLGEIRSDAKRLGGALTSASGSISQGASGLISSMENAEGSIEHTIATLQSARAQLQDTRDRLDQALESDDLTQIRHMIGDDPDSIASFLSAPTELVEHKVFEMATNGDSMSPFYSSLSLWIGAIFLVALASVNVSKKRTRDLKDPKPWQLYLGRYGVFAVIALLQGIVLCIGNIFLVGIQCEHFWLYLLTCCVCALVFSNIVYTLAISFGNIGKAIAIICLVMQLAGTGGIMPVQMSAPIFQDIYPWLPFSHSIDLFSGCIAGFYGDQFLFSMLCLLACLSISLAFGLFCRKPLIRFNAFINAKLDETKFL